MHQLRACPTRYPLRSWASQRLLPVGGLKLFPVSNHQPLQAYESSFPTSNVDWKWKMSWRGWTPEDPVVSDEHVLRAVGLGGALVANIGPGFSRFSASISASKTHPDFLVREVFRERAVFLREHHARAPRKRSSAQEEQGFLARDPPLTRRRRKGWAIAILFRTSPRSTCSSAQSRWRAKFLLLLPSPRRRPRGLRRPQIDGLFPRQRSSTTASSTVRRLPRANPKQALPKRSFVRKRRAQSALASLV